MRTATEARDRLRRWKPESFLRASTRLIAGVRRSLKKNKQKKIIKHVAVIIGTQMLTCEIEQCISGMIGEKTGDRLPRTS